MRCAREREREADKGKVMSWEDSASSSVFSCLVKTYCTVITDLFSAADSQRCELGAGVCVLLYVLYNRTRPKDKSVVTIIKLHFDFGTYYIVWPQYNLMVLKDAV